MRARQDAFASIGAAILIVLAGLLLAAAVLSSGTKASAPAVSPDGVQTPTDFAFSAPLQLPKPVPNPAVFFLQDAEPEIKVDLFGNIYPHSNCNRVALGNGNSHGYSRSLRDSHSYRHTNGQRDSHPNCYCDRHGDTHTPADPNQCPIA